MKKKIFFAISVMLLYCFSLLAQNGGIPVGLKPFNPPTKPPFGGVFPPPKDTFINTPPNSIGIVIKEIIFECFQNSTNLTLQCNEDERVEVIIYEMLSGVKHTSIINMVAGEIYTIATPWGAGLYTIRLTLSNGTMLEGDFQIR